MTRLSVNINKFATIRNARGGNNPDLIKVALDCERFGAQGITVHPRPDERHIRYEDVYQLKNNITSEFNITSNHGWDTIQHQQFLKDIIQTFKQANIRVSIFINPDLAMISAAASTGTDRIELYTEHYAHHFNIDKHAAVKTYVASAKLAHELGLGINAGHDLDLQNLAFLKNNIPQLAEVSIGHALVCDALYLGLENTIQLYLNQLK
jgi:pyridoxine 5-phosphate synthase